MATQTIGQTQGNGPRRSPGWKGPEDVRTRVGACVCTCAGVCECVSMWGGCVHVWGGLCVCV